MEKMPRRTKTYISNVLSKTKQTLKKNLQASSSAGDLLEELEIKDNTRKPLLSRKMSAAKNMLSNLFKTTERVNKRAELAQKLTDAETEAEKSLVRQQFLKDESEKLKKNARKASINDFINIQLLGHGGFGLVRLVRDRATKEIYAMKSLRKADMIFRKQEAHVKAERDMLAMASQVAEWVVRLHSSFQDENNLYFVLEYMPGGDLLGLLIKLDIFPEKFARHYCAEMIMAIEEVHKMGMIHRDIKVTSLI